MELLRHRRRLTLARRGHHLLKGKQDELLRRFLAILEAYMKARSLLNDAVAEVARKSREVRTEAAADTVGAASWPPPPPATVEERVAGILNVKIPARELHLPATMPSYAPTQLPAAFDELSLLWKEVVPQMAEVSNLESTLLLLAEEIERTRRRVNALEYKLIPGLEWGIKTITFRLAEAELGNLTRLMRVKDIVRRS